MDQGIFRQVVDQKLVAGVSWAVLEEGRWQRGIHGKLGVISPYQNQVLTGKESYDLASLTKVVGTTTRVLQLVDAGQLSLATKISEILPQLPFLELPIQALLLHRSGLPADYPKGRSFTEEKLIQFLKETELPREPQLVYSDLGFILLGWVIEALDGTDLEDSFQMHIFQPLGMDHTSYFPPEDARFVPTEVTKERGVVVGRVHDEKAAAFPRLLGHAGLFSTLADMICFVDAIRQNELFSPELFRQLLTMDVAGRTLGWERAFADGILFHTGFTGTAIGIDVQRQRALILLANRIHPSREDRGFLKARFEIYKTFFDTEKA